MNNTEVRLAAKEHGVFIWEIADALGISEASMTRKLRYELSESEKKRMLELINTLVKRR